MDLDDLARQVTRHVGPTSRRIDTPLVTLAMALRRIVDPDHSCRAAVEHLAATRLAAGLAPCSDDTGGYCKARQRLPEALLRDLTTGSGATPQHAAPADMLSHGRVVKIVDGTGCSMPDTPANRAAFALPAGQKVGVGFPMARVLVIVSFACGAVLDAAIGSCRGKKTGECAAPRGLRGGLQSGDIASGDSLYGTYLDIALLARAGVDVIFGPHARRRVDFRAGTRLGPDDHVVAWVKPQCPAWMGRETYDALPATSAIRELRLRLVRPGSRTRVLLIATTPRDETVFSKADLTGLSRLRWQVELDIRSLKQSLAMDVLRCRTPAMVRKGIWGHLLVDNLIRGAMTAAARGSGLKPRELSSQGARQTLRAFAGALKEATDETFAAHIGLILARLARHRVGDRPDRFEPRERKRRPKRSRDLQFPRPEARRRAALAG